MMKISEQLKFEREKQGFSLAEVSLSTKISTRMLKALEAGDLKTLPAPSFIRGFIRSYSAYLKLDPDECIRLFNEEIAPPPAPSIQEPGVESSTQDSPMAVEATPRLRSEEVPSPASTMRISPLEVRPSFLRYALLGLAVVGLVGLIVFVGQTVKKYERERTIDGQHLVEEVPSAPQNEPSAREAAPAAEIPTSQEPEASAAKTPATEAEANEPSAPVAPTTPVVAPTPIEPKPEPVAAVEPVPAAPTGPASAPAPAPAPTPAVTSTRPSKLDQEIILEALDRVEVTVIGTTGGRKKIQLGPGEIHALRAQGPISMEFSDGGVVNLIQNGKELGVPGDLGQPKKVSIP